MAARKRVPPTGRPKGAKNVYRTPLFARGAEACEECCETVRRLALVGLPDARIASALGVSEETLNAWKRRVPEFGRAYRAGRDLALGPVADGLFQVAQRRTVTRTKAIVVDKSVEIVRYDEVVEADVRAATKILESKLPDVWAPRRQNNGLDGDDVEASNKALDQLINEIPGVVKLLGLPNKG
jgi:hypothetical protein